MIVILIVIILTIIFASKYIRRISTPEYKGLLGESKVAKRLRELPDEEYRVFNNIYLKIKDSSIQIDHIVVSLYGIYIIETKNFSGWIFGRENQEYWTQVIYKNKEKFRNPIKQNLAHIKSLKYILSNFENIKYYSIIVFAGTAELKNIVSETPVIYDHQIVRIISLYRDEKIISRMEFEDIISIINENIIQEEDIESKHIQNIYGKKYEKEQKINNKICPKCGGVLVIREGPYGKFYGCSNYPNCRFTLNE
ncbi:NERD domain-containing protein [Brucepastera parasyntrophica]|uniref:NERD domain-containing protein n=1 Tax=Brucepastera parasyntrophica TaxID=2880008 RepID=UPI002108DF90|nr:NERD domain-containing protein [Brucepastera parasyntrophica]ULQ61015.1 NERD domain-containing protein [Brucepastera parasyntrophica]